MSERDILNDFVGVIEQIGFRKSGFNEPDPAEADDLHLASQERRRELLRAYLAAKAALRTAPSSRKEAAEAAPPIEQFARFGPAFPKGLTVRTTDEAETVVGLPVPVGSVGKVRVCGPDLLLVDFPVGCAEFDPHRGAALPLVMVAEPAGDAGYSPDDEWDEDESWDDDEDDGC